MMPKRDPLLPVSPGQHSPLVRNTRAVNAVLEAARAQRGSRRTGVPGVQGVFEGSLLAKVGLPDASAEDVLDAYSVLAYGDPRLSPATEDRRHDGQRVQVFDGEVPSDASAPFMITVESLLGTAIGDAVVSGLAIVQVNVSKASHARAKPKVGETDYLVSADSGGVPVLWKESGTGLKWAMVLLDFADSAALRTADCSRATSFIRANSCATLSILSVSGSCGCIDTSQTAALTWNSDASALTSDDLLYGCPPGVVTTDCPDGAPLKYKIIASGFTGASCLGIDGTWTLTWVSGQTWAQTRGDFTLTMTFTGTTVDLAITGGGIGSAVYYQATGVTDCCADIELERYDDSYCDASPITLTAQVVTQCGNGTPYIPYLDVCEDTCGRPAPRLRWVAQAGSGASAITFQNVGCGVDGDGKPFMDFATDSPLVCTDGATECGDNSLVVRVTCASCWNAGWYCGWNPGTPAQYCVYVEEPPVGNGIYLVDGPFDSSGECSCEREPDSCCETAMPANLCVTVSGWPAPYEYLDGTYFLGAKSASKNDPDAISGGVMITPSLSCPGPGSNYQFNFSANGSPVGAAIGTSFCGAELPYTYDSGGGLTIVFNDDLSCIEDDCAKCVYGQMASVTSSLGTPTPLSGTMQIGAGWAAFAFTISPTTYNIQYSGGEWTLAPLPSVLWELESATRSESGFTVRFSNGLGGYIELTCAVADGCESCDPIGESYNCLDSGSCIDPGDGSGQYATLAECVASCTASEGGGGGGSGEGDCRACSLLGLDAELDIPDGTYAGTYSSGGIYPVWTNSGSGPAITIQGLDDPIIVLCRSSDGVVVAAGTPVGGSSIASDTTCGTPTVMTFPGAAFGATGDVTLTTPAPV